VLNQLSLYNKIFIYRYTMKIGKGQTLYST